ncbi:GNAT family N-acetyltransferase [Veronia pacifica]|uniref:Histone acetyltransferase n=1 Tax=Veronia pacifica TaxID=1080227 RepID=A0A1C3EMQ5_9GAMM|nr:GNAT family N-acetyltransferase [Veronia pacifica]ODA34527.1 histone acetyltransferase [Veronia pacifica]
MNIDFVFAPSEAQISHIYQGLLAFNEPHFFEIHERSIGCFISNEKNEMLGGLTGRLMSKCLHINYLWLPDMLRGKGIGRELILTVESEAKHLNIHNIYLDTYSFQAPGFYERLGFREVGRYTDFPKQGVDKIFYQKSLLS